MQAKHLAKKINKQSQLSSYLLDLPQLARSVQLIIYNDIGTRMLNQL